MRRGTVIFVLSMCLAAPVLAETMYARFSTPVRSGRGLSAQTLGKLAQGEAVEVLGRAGNYFRVSYRGKPAYVYYNKLADEKPEDISALLGAGFAAEGIELTELEAGGALRGLSPMAENYAQASQVPEWAVAAVEAMQGRVVTADELEGFQREGRLGEYGEEAEQ